MDKREMNSVGPKTPEEVDKKWKPVTGGLTAREAVYAAHVMEAEARFLNKQQESPLSKKEHIPGLKYIFPIIRRAVPNLLDGDLTDDTVRNAFRGAANAVFETDSTRHGMIVNEVPTPEETAKFIDLVADRAKVSIEGLRAVL